ncbi:site-2 protease family protein [Desulfovibrio sp. JY]|nr:site-2 protease family protein [Desulfovibrio sp. JY]
MPYVAVIALLAILVFIHELGHFLAAKALGLPVARFSLGFGPVLWSRSFGGTRYCLSAVPLGGYVLLDLIDSRDYLARPLAARLLFSLAGPLANVLAACGCYGVACFLTPGAHGLAALWQPFVWTAKSAGLILSSIPELFRHAGELSSLVGIVAEGGRYVRGETVRLFLFGGYLSMSLAVFNLLPLPPLDGGKIVFDSLERCASRFARFYLPSAVCGWLVLIALMVYATANDIVKYLA